MLVRDLDHGSAELGLHGRGVDVPHRLEEAGYVLDRGELRCRGVELCARGVLERRDEILVGGRVDLGVETGNTGGAGVAAGVLVVDGVEVGEERLDDAVRFFTEVYGAVLAFLLAVSGG